LYDETSLLAAAILAPSTTVGTATTTTTTTTTPAVATAAKKAAKAAAAEVALAAKPGKTSKRKDKENDDKITNTGTTVEVTPNKKRKAIVHKEPDQPLPSLASIPVDDGKTRCIWANSPRYPLLQAYHDEEWNHPGGFDHSNRYLFELLILEGAQAGLSWSTVLHKREAYREAYHQFDFHRIATTYRSPTDNDRLLQTNIVKNRLKVQASMINAKAYVELLQELYPDQTGLDDTKGFWMFLQDYKKKSTKKEKEPTEYLTRSPESDRLSEDLKKRGFKFVGACELLQFSLPFYFFAPLSLPSIHYYSPLSPLLPT